MREATSDLTSDKVSKIARFPACPEMSLVFPERRRCRHGEQPDPEARCGEDAQSQEALIEILPQAASCRSCRRSIRPPALFHCMVSSTPAQLLLRSCGPWKFNIKLHENQDATTSQAHPRPDDSPR